jgi:hypothetical protein
MVAGGAFARLQPSGAFGLQIADGALDRLVDLLFRCRSNRRWFYGKS